MSVFLEESSALKKHYDFVVMNDRHVCIYYFLPTQNLVVFNIFKYNFRTRTTILWTTIYAKPLQNEHFWSHTNQNASSEGISTSLCAAVKWRSLSSSSQEKTQRCFLHRQRSSHVVFSALRTMFVKNHPHIVMSNFIRWFIKGYCHRGG